MKIHRMMRIPTRVAASQIPGAGNGLFTECFVAAGEVIWQFDPGLDLLLEGLPEDPILRAFVERYGYEPLGEPGRWLVCVDNARFINHSSDPNTYDTRNHTFATVDLPPGTEITSDYHAFCERPFLGWPDAVPPLAAGGSWSGEMPREASQSSAASPAVASDKQTNA
ncbi:SET domain-containing protein [Sabulicella rubraurantiaca]|uniref:SET domain-containing protein n=1 Tax=Sabulicella rubraurantiaca TaxID=2811429 RepID=UPI002E2D02B9|nr:SET domain-containing protein [Sabulicella rubraurantiaca]